MLLAAAWLLLASPASAAPACPGKQLEEMVRLDHAPKAARAKLRAAFRRAASTPTGAPLAREFCRMGLAVSVQLLEDGPEQPHGEVRILEGWAIVMINSKLVESPAGLLVTVAHEWLGHALIDTRLARREEDMRALRLLDLDERRANAVAAAVSVEAGVPLEEANQRPFIDDPRAAMEGLALESLHYANGLSPAELPGGAAQAYAGRLRRARIALSEVATKERELSEWMRIFAHLTKAHGIGPGRYAAARKAVVDGLSADLPARRRLLSEVRDLLLRNVANAETSEGAEQAAWLARMARSPWALVMQAETERFLAAARGGPPPAPNGPPPSIFPAGELDWNRLLSIVEADHRNHPDHWPLPRDSAPLAAASTRRPQ